MKKVVFVFLLVAILVSCRNGPVSDTDENVRKHETIDVRSVIIEQKYETLVPPPIVQKTKEGWREKFLKERSGHIFTCFNKNSYAMFAQLADVERGIRFTPYGNPKEKDVVMKVGFLIGPTNMGIGADSIIYNWGNYDGSGEAIKLNLKNYSKKFICDKNYWNDSTVTVEYTENTEAGKGFYKNVNKVSYKYPGTAKNNRMDWSSVTFVYKDYWLIGVIHDQWKI
ncbi:MAG: hypothetical protein IAF38_04550 [Bacteroidia bacterium]|nr:hypothetical protein [Bacteroidia bacterium]